MLYLFDLDGTLISSYMEHPTKEYAAWYMLPGRITRIAQLLEEGHSVSVVTNQGSVAFGYTALDEVHTKFRQVSQLLHFGGMWIHHDTSTSFEGWHEEGQLLNVHIFVCYADPRATVEKYRDGAYRRKPSPVMLHEACVVFNHAVEDTHYIGDRPEDQQAAHAAGIPFTWAEVFFSSTTDG